MIKKYQNSKTVVRIKRTITALIFSTKMLTVGEINDFQLHVIRCTVQILCFVRVCLIYVNLTCLRTRADFASTIAILQAVMVVKPR